MIYLDAWQETLAVAAAVFLRVGAAVAVLPVFGERVVPVRVRLSLALAFVAILTPALVEHPALGRDARWGWLLASETVAGLALGAALRLLVAVLQMAGSMAAQATSLSQILGGQAVDPLPALGHIMMLAGLAAFVTLDLHVRIVELFLLSYDILPPGRLPPAGDLLAWGSGRVAQAFSLAFTLAAPFVIASLVYNLALGVINRAMPQLMVAFVGAPAITAGALVILALALPAILTVWLEAISKFFAGPFEPPP